MKVGITAICLVILLFAKSAGAQTTTATFQLFPNPAFVDCLRKSPLKTPKATVTVTKGNLRDTLTLTLKNVKPGLAFDLFTVEHSNQLFNGDPDPAFTNFGLAWYQSDVEADEFGTATVTIKTILLNQIFGFDPAASLPPTNTFHVGFWFNDPNDAANCGFNVNNPTPFNGEHEAGPLAMISRPAEATGLGPLCINPNTSTDPATCNP
jgi:hypothetical protein